MSKVRLGELLIQLGKIDADQLKVALNYQKKWGKKIGQCLVELKFVNEKELCEALSKSLKIPVVDITRLEPSAITKEILDIIPVEVARKHRLLPISIREIRYKRRLVVATSDPTNYKTFDEIQFKHGLPLLVMIVPDTDIDWFIRKFYLGEADAIPEDYVSAVHSKADDNGGEFIGSLSSIFSDAEFTNATREHRKKTDKDK